MKTIKNFGSKFGTTILDFMDRAPLVLPSILTIVIVAGFLFLG